MNTCRHLNQEIDFVAEIRADNCNFLLFQCRNCREFFSFPKGKLKTALKLGTPKTLDLLRSYGVPVEN